MAKKNDQLVAYGRYVQDVRMGLGLDRDVFAGRIGVSSQTLRNVEQGHQRLGKAAQLAVERLADGEMVRETAPRYDKGQVLDAETIARFVVDDRLREQAKQVARITGMEYEDAVEMIIRERLLKG